MKPTDGSFDETLTPEQAATTQVDTAGVSKTAGQRTSLPPAFQLGSLLGRGGMGEVLVAEEVEIGRSVAIKRMRGDVGSPEMAARFLREAKIQARLDHPSIVPVHVIGHDSAGRPYFTMKRLTGTTLAEVLEAGRDTLQRLLRAFGDVCLAIEFAHAKGFIHRDLKPANIMLGDYGEVYVLDWGLARELDGAPVTGRDDQPVTATRDSLGGETQLGAVMGTPGYMSPEQLRGEEVGRPTDVYALGAILFEILAGQPLHPRGQPVVAAPPGGKLSPAERAPERNVALELDRICIEALAETPARRPSAEALAAAIQHYLDGDRDLEARRARADKLLAAARADHESGDPDRRASAMQAAGRALALDPDSAGAAALVSTLMLEPPKTLPAPLANDLARIDTEHVHVQARLAVVSLSSYFAFVPLLLWMGIRDWTTMIITFVMVAVAIGHAALIVKGRRMSLTVTMIVNALVIAMMSQFTSPFVLLPAVVAGSAVSFTTLPQFLHRPVLVVGTFMMAFVGPIVLEVAGVLPRSWELNDGWLAVRPPAVSFEGVSAFVFLIAGSIAALVVLSQFVRSLAITQRTARRQLVIQGWHLGQLINPMRD